MSSAFLAHETEQPGIEPANYFDKYFSAMKVVPTYRAKVKPLCTYMDTQPIKQVSQK